MVGGSLAHARIRSFLLDDRRSQSCFQSRWDMAWNSSSRNCASTNWSFSLWPGVHWLSLFCFYWFFFFNDRSLCTRKFHFFLFFTLRSLSVFKSNIWHVVCVIGCKQRLYFHGFSLLFVPDSVYDQLFRFDNVSSFWLFAWLLTGSSALSSTLYHCCIVFFGWGRIILSWLHDFSFDILESFQYRTILIIIAAYRVLLVVETFKRSMNHFRLLCQQRITSSRLRRFIRCRARASSCSDRFTRKGSPAVLGWNSFLSLQRLGSNHLGYVIPLTDWMILLFHHVFVHRFLNRLSCLVVAHARR